jgi:cytidylate kinase
MMKFMVIAIDGPAASGKSTTARLLASRLGFTYLDTGAMYRSVTLAALEEGIDLGDEDAVASVAQGVDIAYAGEPEEVRVIMNGRDVTLDIRTPRVDASVSQVSSYKTVRSKMVALQRKLARRGHIVAEGRDMGTVVFPDADLKIFLVADISTRAIRRCRQLEGFGLKTTIEEQLASLSSRDLFDSERANSPLKKAPDAIEFDTSGMSINEQVQKAWDLARERLGIK